MDTNKPVFGLVVGIREPSVDMDTVIVSPPPPPHTHTLNVLNRVTKLLNYFIPYSEISLVIIIIFIVNKINEGIEFL